MNWSKHFLENGPYNAPDLTKAWLDPKWNQLAFFGKPTKEEGIAEFLMNPDKMGTHTRKMPNLKITKEEAQALVAFLKHMSAIDTNGFPRGFSKTVDEFKQGGTYAK